MKTLPQTDWIQWGEYFGVSWFHGCYMSGMAFEIRERLGYGLTQMVGEQDGDVLRIYLSRSEWTEIGKRYFDEVLQKPEKLRILLADIRSAADALFSFSRQLESMPFATMEKNQYVPLLKQYHDLHHPLWALGMVANVLDLENDVMRVYLKHWLGQAGLNMQEVELAFQTLVAPRELSFAQHEQDDMLVLGTKEQTEDMLKKHWETYRSIQFAWTGPDLSLDYFFDVQKRLLHEGKAEEYLAALNKEQQALEAEKEMWIQKVSMPKAMREIFRLYEELLFVKTHRMDALFLSYSAIQPLLKKIAKDYFLSLRQVYAAYIPWLINMIKTDSFDTKYLNDVSAYSIQYVEDGALHIATQNEARDMLASLKAQLPKQKETHELKGECGYPGEIVRGKVCIVNRVTDMDAFEDGDVLVSNVTDPSLLPAMKRASAFVTDQGGLTCHAAIVARELKTPCIVGTKIGTKVFKNGDMVEVDATKGIVRKV